MLLLTSMHDDLDSLKATDDKAIAGLVPRLAACISVFENSAWKLIDRAKSDLGAGLWVAVPFLTLAGVACGAWMWGKAAVAAQRKLAQGEGDAAFHRAQIAQAAFYMAHVATQADGLAATVVEGMTAATEL